MFTCLLLAFVFVVTVSAFLSVVPPQRCSLSSPNRSPLSLTRLFVVDNSKNEYGARRGITLPLLDILDSEEYRNQYIQPLPSAHLPDELTTLHVYGMQVVVPVHQSVLEYAVEHDDSSTTMDGKSTSDRNFGHLAWKPDNRNKDDNNLVGAIGCAAQVLIPPGMLQTETTTLMDSKATATAAELFEQGKPQVMLCRGTFRFIVREIKQSFPFPVAIVDELLDNNDSVTSGTDEKTKENDDDNDDDDMYADLSKSQLIRLTLQAMQSFVDQQLKATSQAMSPLEQSIIEQSGFPDMSAQRQATEEMSAVWEVFQQYLVDDCPVSERAKSVAFLAAEMANMSNDVRRKILCLADSTERLRVVLRELESTVGLVRALKVAQTISQEVSPGGCDPKDLQVGKPSLPSWASHIRKGMQIEYFWNEEYEWCAGTVIEDPVFVVDEYLITIKFDDGEVHKLPFEADEKARWRPGRASFE